MARRHRARLSALPPGEPLEQRPRALLAPYRDIIAAFNPDGGLRFYPGSPLIANALLRRQDRLIACEAGPGAAGSLRASLRGDHRAKVLTIDGWMALNANVPPKERRGVVLVDPPYEDAADFARLPAALAAAHRKWPTGIYMLWYPIKERGAADALARRLRRLGVAKILRCEIVLGAATRRHRLGRIGPDPGQSALPTGRRIAGFAAGAGANLRPGRHCQGRLAGARALVEPPKHGPWHDLLGMIDVLPLFHPPNLVY